MSSNIEEIRENLRDGLEELDGELREIKEAVIFALRCKHLWLRTNVTDTNEIIEARDLENMENKLDAAADTLRDILEP